MSQIGTYTITGTVNQLSGGLPGVNVFISDKDGNIKLPTKGTATDANGNYQLLATTLDKYITFSFVGYEKKTLPITSDKINVELKEQSNDLEAFEVVAKREENKPFDWKTTTAIVLLILFIVGLIIYHYKTAKK